MGKYYSTKTYDIGLSACFRQWRAEGTMCKFIHGYALTVKIVFGCSELDERNWCQDFGGLKPVKQMLQDTFDHKTVVAEDDPMLEKFQELDQAGLIQLVILENVGCEAFAKYVFDMVSEIVSTGECERQPTTCFEAKQAMVENTTPRVWVESVEVMEHGANSAIYSK